MRKPSGGADTIAASDDGDDDYAGLDDLDRPARSGRGLTIVLVAINLALVGGGIFFLSRYLAVRSEASSAAPAQVSDGGVAALPPATPTSHSGPAVVVRGKGMKVGKDQGQPVRSRTTTTITPATGPVLPALLKKPDAGVASPTTPVTPVTPTTPGPDAAPLGPAPTIPVDAEVTATTPSADAATAPPAPPPPTIDLESVDREVRSHGDQVTACYQRAQKADTKLAGEIEMQFRIDAEGRARNARAIRNTTNSPDLATCLANLIEAWTFPKPTADMDFIWPFVFSPAD